MYTQTMLILTVVVLEIMSFATAIDIPRNCTETDYPMISAPYFSWTNSPQLVAFTFEGPIGSASIEQHSILETKSGKPVVSTWFVSGSFIDSNVLAELASDGVEFGAFAMTAAELTSALQMLKASSVTNVVGFRGGASAELRSAGVAAGLAYDASLNPRRPFSTWPFLLKRGICSCFDNFKGEPLTCPSSETNDGLHAVPVIAPLETDEMAAWLQSFSFGFAANYNQKRVPIVVSVTDLIKTAGRNATSALLKEILSYEEVQVVAADQVSALLAATSEAEAKAIHERQVLQTDGKPSANPIGTPTQASNSPGTSSGSSTGSLSATPQSSAGATTTIPRVSTGPVQATSEPSSSSGSATPAPSAGLVAPTADPTDGRVGSTPAPSVSLVAPTADPADGRVGSTPAPSVSLVAPTADPADGRVGLTPAPSPSLVAPTADPAVGSTSAPSTTVDSNATLIDAPRLSIAPSAPPAAAATAAPGNAGVEPLLPTLSPKATTAAPTSAPATSSSSSTTYVWIVSVGGVACAFFVFVAYRTYGAKDRFPPVITTGYAFESEDRDIYDLESQQHGSYTDANLAAAGGAGVSSNTDLNNQLDMLSLERSDSLMSPHGADSSADGRRPTFPSAFA